MTYKLKNCDKNSPRGSGQRWSYASMIFVRVANQMSLEGFRKLEMKTCPFFTTVAWKWYLKIFSPSPHPESNTQILSIVFILERQTSIGH